jgi:hypothetical protein
MHTQEKREKPSWVVADRSPRPGLRSGGRNCRSNVSASGGTSFRRRDRPCSSVFLNDGSKMTQNAVVIGVSPWETDVCCFRTIRFGAMIRMGPFSGLQRYSEFR